MRKRVTRPGEEEGPGLAGVMERNIEALILRRREEEARKPLEQRVADAVTAFTGSMRFVYLHVALYGLWIVINLGWVPFVSKFDPSFVVLAMVASVEAIFLSTFILISQNRMAEVADRRDELNLQISLLSEHEVTRLISLTKAVAQRLGIEESQNPELSELARDIAPEAVLDRIDQSKKEAEEGAESPKPGKLTR